MVNPPALVDPECFALAEYFIPNGSDARKWQLAEVVQNAVENWLIYQDKGEERKPDAQEQP